MHQLAYSMPTTHSALPLSAPLLLPRFSENASTSDLALELRQQIPWARQYRVLLE